MSKQNKEILGSLALKDALDVLLKESFKERYKHSLSENIDAQKRDILKSKDSTLTKIGKLQKTLTMHQVFADVNKMPTPLKVMVEAELALVNI